MDISMLLKAKQAKDLFFANHPKFPAFVNAVRSKGIPENTELLITVTYPDGQNMKAGLKIRQSDLELLRLFSELTTE